MSKFIERSESTAKFWCFCVGVYPDRRPCTLFSPALRGALGRSSDGAELGPQIFYRAASELQR